MEEKFIKDDLKRKVALVSGGSSDIGKSIISMLLEEGFFVYATYFKSDNLIKSSNLKWIKLDVSDPKNIENLDKEIPSEENIDVLINCIGVAMNKLLVDVSTEEIIHLININQISHILFSKYAIKKMIKSNGGRIINISSIWGNTGASCESIYSSSKGGVELFSKSIAREYAKMNIYVNTIAPGYIDTKMNQYTEYDKKNILEEIPLNKFGKTEDVVECVKYLLYSEYITGQSFNINGGWI